MSDEIWERALEDIYLPDEAPRMVIGLPVEPVIGQIALVYEGNKPTIFIWDGDIWRKVRLRSESGAE